jgi:peptidoglycan/LPS O-acetylase OafA/YrhL
MSHFNYRNISSFDAGGDCGVAFFFLLSGFVLSMGYGSKIDNNTFSFYGFIKRRLIKVYPLHLLCLLLFLIIFRPDITIRLLFNTLLLQSWIPDDSYYFSYNGVSWFLSSILFCYFLFPFAYRNTNKRTLFFIVVYYIIAYIVIPYKMVNELLYVSPFIRFVDFYLGIILYKIYKNRKGITSNASLIELLLVILLSIALIVYPYTDEKFRNAPLYWFILLPIIYVFTQQQGVVSRCLQYRVLQWLGSLSMPIFMLHPIVFRTMFHFFPSIPSLLMLILCFSITVALSWGMDLFLLRKIEKIRINC